MGNSLRVTTLASAIGFALISASFSPSAHAAPVTTTKATSSATANTRETYIIRFTEPGLLHYSGGTQGLAATAPSATHERKLDARSPAAQAYGNYLQSQRGAHLQAEVAFLGAVRLVHEDNDVPAVVEDASGLRELEDGRDDDLPRVLPEQLRKLGARVGFDEVREV
jgi:hypothetical protein